MSNSEAYDRIEACLSVLYSPEEVERWWKTPMRWLDDETPQRYIRRPDGMQFVLKCLLQLSH